MNNLMLDIETMGTGPNAAIMAIGACYFDPVTGDVGDTFHEQVNLDSYGEIDASTVIWWMKQDDEARSKFYDNHKARNINEVLHDFSKFVKPNTQVWGNGVAFDNVKIDNAYRSRGLKTPWDFWNDRDVRTMVELGKIKGVDPKRDLPFEGVKHDALADAIHQAKYVSLIYRVLVL